MRPVKINATSGSGGAVAQEMTNEAKTLLTALSHQRDHVLVILSGLSEEDLRRPVLPSGWTTPATSTRRAS